MRGKRHNPASRLYIEKAVDDFSTYAIEISHIRSNHEGVRPGAFESCPFTRREIPVQPIANPAGRKTPHQ